MKWYTVRCDQCRWVSPLIDEKAAAKFAELRLCQNCKAAGLPDSPFRITETITSTLPLKGL